MSHNHTKAFSLIELLLVIIIILILFLASKNLFQTPNKYLIDSEVCINTLHGKITQFFYQGVTGKDKTINGITYEPNVYRISFSGGLTVPEQNISLFVSTGSNIYQLDNTININTVTATIPACNTNSYTVILSGSIYQNTGYTSVSGFSIYLNKNLDNSLSKAGMTICNGSNCGNIFTSKIDYLTCKKISGSNTIDTNSCKHLFSTRFDTSTQSVKGNRCLNILYDQACRKRSIDNF